MFSISTMSCAASDADRYLRQEHKALERYYNGPESDLERGVYVGGTSMGLDGTVVGEEFRMLLDARNPQGESLYKCPRDNRRIGFDLTFSPDKSVSLLWARSSESARREIEATVFKATKATLHHIEKNILHDCVRRGKGGEFREAPKELTFAVFQHGSSRAGDPQLHHHALLLNAAERQDGTWGALQEKAIFTHQGEIRRYFDLALASHLKRDFGIEVETRKEGIRIPGVSQDLIDMFSKRRNDIAKLKEETGVTTAAARERYALDSRESKKATERELLPSWQKEFDELGFTCEVAHGILRDNEFQSSLGLAPEVREQEIEKRIDGVFTKFGETALTLTDREIRKVVAEKFVGLAEPAEFEGLCRRVLEDSRLQELHADAPGVRRFTTAGILEQEGKLSSSAQELAERHGHSVESSLTESILVRRVAAGMSIEQAEATKEALQKGDLALIYGAAGTGKSYSLSALREVAEAHGYTVRGLAPTGKAAESLEKSSTIASKTIHKYLYDFERGKDAFEKRDIVVIDEAGMLGSEKTKILLEHAQEKGAKIILVGDDKQLSPIDAGSPFAKLKETFGASQILTIRRQSEEWQREAAENIRTGQVNKALCHYEEQGKIHHHTTWEHTRQELVATYLREREPGKCQLILAPTNALRREINDDVRQARFEARELLHKHEVKLSTLRDDGGVETRTFTQGDRIYFLQNRADLGVKNGTLGTIETIVRTGRGRFDFTVKIDDDRTVKFSSDKYRAIDHGYAATVHKSQGDTVHKSYVVVTKGMGKEDAYVALTRHKEEAQIYCATELVHRARADMQKEEASLYQKKLNLDAMTRSLTQERVKSEGLVLKERFANVPTIPLPLAKSEVPEFGIYATSEHKQMALSLPQNSREEVTETLYRLASDPMAMERSLAQYPLGKRADYQVKAQEILSTRDYSQKNLQELQDLVLRQHDGVRPILTAPEKRAHYESVQGVVSHREKAKVYDKELITNYITPKQHGLLQELCQSPSEERQIDILKDLALERIPQSPTFGIPKDTFHRESFGMLKDSRPPQRLRWAENALGHFQIGKEGQNINAQWGHDVKTIHHEIKLEIEEAKKHEKKLKVERSREMGISL